MPLPAVVIAGVGAVAVGAAHLGRLAMALGPRLSKAAGNVFEFKINPASIGVAVAGGTAATQYAGTQADRRHTEMMAQNERQHAQRLALEQAKNAELVNALRSIHEQQTNAGHVARSRHGETTAGIGELRGDFRQAQQAIAGIQRRVDGVSRQIDGLGSRRQDSSASASAPVAPASAPALAFEPQ
jgi:hypothetical protein